MSGASPRPDGPEPASGPGPDPGGSPGPAPGPAPAAAEAPSGHHVSPTAPVDLDTPDDRRTHLAGAVMGGVLLLFAAVTLVDAAGLGGGSGSAPLGAAAFPALVALLLIVVGGVLLATSVRSLGRAPAGPPLAKDSVKRLAGMLVALVVFAVALPYAGFTVCAALLFTAAAWLLGAPHPVRTLAYGWTLAGLLFILFDVLIGLSLPSGPWGF